MGPAGWTEQPCYSCTSGTDSRAVDLVEIPSESGNGTEFRPVSIGCESESSVAFVGGDIDGGVAFTASEQECCQACRGKPDCWAWTYYDRGFCYQKGAEGWVRQDCPEGEFCTSGKVDR